MALDIVVSLCLCIAVILPYPTFQQIAKPLSQPEVKNGHQQGQLPLPFLPSAAVANGSLKHSPVKPLPFLHAGNASLAFEKRGVNQNCGPSCGSCCSFSANQCCPYAAGTATCCPDQCYSGVNDVCCNPGACASGYTCCGNGCCSPGYYCSNGLCYASGTCSSSCTSCCSISANQCCSYAPGTATCCPDQCYLGLNLVCCNPGACPTGYTCCGNGCCSPGYYCSNGLCYASGTCSSSCTSCCSISANQCCPYAAGTATCCPDQCYPGLNLVCCNPGTCLSGYTCCGNGCCSPGYYCSNGQCYPSRSVGSRLGCFSLSLLMIALLLATVV